MIIIIPFLLTSLLFLAGCLWKNHDTQKNSWIANSTVENDLILPEPQYQYEKISQDNILDLGFIVLPFYNAITCHKKSDILYVLDTFYPLTPESERASYQTIKDLYCNAGWSLEEECFTDQYSNLFFTQVDRHLVVFLQHKKNYKDNTKNKLFIHQTMIIHR